MLRSLKKRIFGRAFTRRAENRQEIKRSFREVEVPDFDDNLAIDFDQNVENFPPKPELLNGFLASFALAALAVFSLIYLLSAK